MLLTIFPQQKKLENLLPNFAGSSPRISPKTSPTSLWKSLVLIFPGPKPKKKKKKSKRPSSYIKGLTRRPRHASVFSTHSNKQAVPAFHCIQKYV